MQKHIEDVQKKQDEISKIEVQKYINQRLNPTLTEALKQVVILKPEKPIEFLGKFLLENNPENAQILHQKEQLSRLSVHEQLIMQKKEEMKQSRLSHIQQQMLVGQDDGYPPKKIEEEEEDEPVGQFGKLKHIDVVVAKSHLQERILKGQFLKKSSSQQYELQEKFQKPEIQARPTKIHFQDDVEKIKQFQEEIQQKKKQHQKEADQPESFQLNVPEKYKQNPPAVNTQLKKFQNEFDNVKTPMRSSFSNKSTKKIKNMNAFTNRWKLIQNNPMIQMQVLENMDDNQFKEICNEGIDLSLMIDIFNLFKKVECDTKLKVRYIDVITTLKRFDVNMKALLRDEKEAFRDLILDMKSKDIIKDNIFNEYIKFLEQ